MTTLLELSDADVGTILAALRLYRNTLTGQKEPADVYEALASQGGMEPPLTADEVQALFLDISMPLTEEQACAIA